MSLHVVKAAGAWPSPRRSHEAEEVADSFVVVVELHALGRHAEQNCWETAIWTVVLGA